MNFFACKNKIIFFLVLLLSGFNVQAGVLLDSSFAGSSPSLNTPWTATDSIDPNLIYSGWDASWHGGDVHIGALPYPQSWQTTGTADNVFAFELCNDTQVVNGQAIPTSLADAVNHDQYIYFTLAPNSGSLNLNDKKVIFRIQRLNDYNAPQKYSVFTSVGGFQPGSELFTASIPAKSNYADNEFSFIMPASSYDNITGTIEFRIYVYETTYCWHPTSLTDFVIQDAGPLYNLSLSGTSGGTVSTNPPDTRFEEGTVVQLLAAPGPGYHFVGWSGDVSGKGNPRSVTMMSDISATANFAANVDGRIEVGLNLAKINDWSSSDPFVDVFKMFRSWATTDTSWAHEWECWDSGKSSEIPLDANGWPAYLPFVAGATVCESGVVSDDPMNADSTHYVHTILSDSLPGGDYHVIVEGAGKIKFKGPVVSPTNVLELAGGTTEFTLQIAPDNNGSLLLYIYESQSRDPVRSIRIIRPGYTSTYETQTFQTSYLNRLEPFAMLRFIDWGKTINSPLVTWNDRTSKETYTQTRDQGVALEYMVELANTLQKDLWINIPHKADDNYVRQAARLLRDTVGPNQKIYIEYSNETWNSSYSEATYVQDQGQALNLDSDRWVAGNKYTVLRSVQIWKIFQEEFGADTRVRRVLASQAGNVTTSVRVAAVNDPAINPDYLMPDVLAIAPYFGHIYTPNDIPPIAPSYPTVDEILDEGGVATASIEQQRLIVQNHTAIADAQGLELVCYEAGQHFVGLYAALNDTTLTDILIAANRDDRMYQRYLDYAAMLEAEGPGTCAFYADIERPSKYGSWGVLEYLEQPVSEAPKYRALIDFITEPADLSVSSMVNPNPAYLNEALTYTFSVINNGYSDASDVTLVDTLPAGVAFVSATPQGGCANDNGVVTCNLGSLAVGASTPVTITATAMATGTLSNTASVSARGVDPNPANNSATATATIVAPDLASIGISASKHGQKIYVTDTVQNQGDGAAGAFNVAYYLSTDTTYESGADIPLAAVSDGGGVCARSVVSLSAGSASSVTDMTCYKPSSGTTSGVRYHVLAVDDATNQVIESNEANNVRATGDQVWW